MILSKVKDVVIAALATCVGFLALALGLSKGQRNKKRIEDLNEDLSRADNERLNRMYVKKVRLDRRIDEFNRLSGLLPRKEDDTDTDDET